MDEDGAGRLTVQYGMEGFPDEYDIGLKSQAVKPDFCDYV